jgi:hypothetical protein
MGDQGAAPACSVAAADSHYLAAHADLRALINQTVRSHQLLVRKSERDSQNDRRGRDVGVPSPAQLEPDALGTVDASSCLCEDLMITA